MRGKPTRITAICQSYHDGLITWPQAREELLSFPYRTVVATYPDLASTGLPSSDYGTWDEVVQCYCDGLITDAEYADLLGGLQAQADQHLVH